MARNLPKYKTQERSWRRSIDVQWKPAGASASSPPFKEYHEQILRRTDTVAYGPNISNWRLRLMLGEGATTTLTGTRYSSKGSELRMLATGVGPLKGAMRQAVGFNPQGYFLPPPTKVINSVAERIAASRFLADYLKQKRTWAGGSTIAEFAETVRMLAKPYDSLYQHTFTFVGAVGRLKRVYRRNKVLYGKLLGQLWLAYAFGIAPMVADVNSAYAAVKSLSESLGSVDTKRIIGTGTHSVVLDVQNNQPVSFANYCLADRVAIREDLVRYIGAVRCKPPGVSAIAENFGVGFTDIAPSVWEGVPWSWLVDYFVNVNEMLESISLAYADFSWVNLTVRNRVVNQFYGVKPDLRPQTGYSVTAAGGQAYFQSAVVDRKPTSVPYPSWSFRIPGLPRQYANVAALSLAIRRSKP